MLKTERGEAFKENLKQLGKWQEYQAMVKGLIEGGLRGTNAHQKARRHYTELYPQLSTIGGVLPAWARLKKKDFEGKPKISHKEAVDWALEHASFKDVKPLDAPSATAWLYLHRMRNDPTFLNDILKKRVPNLSRAQQTEGMTDDGRKQFNLIDKLEAEAEARSADAVLPPCPEKVAV